MPGEGAEGPAKIDSEIDRLVRAIRELLVDPVTQHEMNDPVVASDGHLYDRSVIEKWIATRGVRAISPRTGRVLPSHTLRSCFEVTRLIEILNEVSPYEKMGEITDGDLEFALKLYSEELEEKLRKVTEQRTTAEEEYARLRHQAEDNTTSMHDKIAFYEQMLTLTEAKIKRLTQENARLMSSLSRQGQDAAASAELGPASLPAAAVPQDAVSLDVIDLSSQFTVSRPALVEILVQNPSLRLLKTGIYGECWEGRAHEFWIDKIIPSPDGGFYTGSQHPTIKKWDPLTMRCTAELRGHEPLSEMDIYSGRSRKSQVYDLALSPCGEKFASASADGTVRIWSIQTNEMLKSVKLHEGDICCVCFLDKDTIVSGGRDRQIMVTRLLRDGHEVKVTLTGHTVDVYSVHFLREKNLLVSAAGYTDKAEIFVWDLTTKRKVRELKGHVDLNYEMIKTPNEAYVITGCDDHTIRVWNTETWESILLTGHMHYVNTLAMVDDNILVSGGEDRTVRFWDISTGHCLATCPAKGKIWGIAALGTGDVVCGDTSGMLYRFAKMDFDLSFREALKGIAWEVNGDHISLTASLAVDRARIIKSLRSWIDFLHQCGEFRFRTECTWGDKELCLLIRPEIPGELEPLCTLMDACYPGSRDVAQKVKCIGEVTRHGLWASEEGQGAPGPAPGPESATQ